MKLSSKRIQNKETKQEIKLRKIALIFEKYSILASCLRSKPDKYKVCLKKNYNKDNKKILILQHVNRFHFEVKSYRNEKEITQIGF